MEVREMMSRDVKQRPLSLAIFQFSVKIGYNMVKIKCVMVKINYMDWQVIMAIKWHVG